MARKTSLSVTASFVSLCLMGCVLVSPDQDNTGTGDDPLDLATFTGKVYVVGELAGTLADEIDAATEATPYDGTSADAPVILSGDWLADSAGALSDELTAIIPGLLATLEAHFPIIVVHANDEDILVLLHNALNLDLDFELPTGITYAEVYALDREEGGHLFQWAQYPPSLDEGETDDDLDQIARANLLIDWLEDDGTRITAADIEQAKQAAQASANDLTSLASAFVNQSNFYLKEANFQVTHYIYTCYSTDTSTDWFYVQQQCVFAAANAYKWSNFPFNLLLGYGYDIAGWYMDKIDIQTYMLPGLNNTAAVGLVSSSPETANGVTNVSSGTNWNIGGNVMFGAKSGATASTGVTISNSRSFSVQDCTVANLSNGSGNDAHWKYDFKRCEAVSYYAYAGLTTPPLLARSTFQPLNQWVWWMSSQERTANAKMQVTLVPTLVRSRGIFDFYWATHVDSQLYPGFFIYTVSMPYLNLATTD